MTVCECNHNQGWHWRSIHNPDPRRNRENKGLLVFKYCMHPECCPTYNVLKSKCVKWRPKNAA